MTPPYKCLISGAEFAKRFLWAVLWRNKYGRISNMKGITLTFVKQVESGVDALNNPTYTTESVDVDDCLIAPIIEPATAREQQAMEQSRDQVRIHMPKASSEDVSDSDVTWNGKVFHIDSDSVVFMDENTPTRWNRYFRGECING
jgi:hypothetical protein